MTESAKVHAPATARNREPIRDVLARIAPSSGLVLEIASGSGEHAAFFAQALPGIVWQPSDRDTRSIASIAAHREASGLPNLLPPVRLDVLDVRWPLERADMIVCVNMIHIAPWAACEGLMRGAGRLLAADGVLYLYGPFKTGDRHSSASNRIFDDDLRARDPDWGVRDCDAVVSLASQSGLRVSEIVTMPANNQSVIFRKAK